MPRVIALKPVYRRYDFDALKHGDAIEVASVKGAREMFRRWLVSTGRRARLTTSKDRPTLLYFLDETVGA